MKIVKNNKKVFFRNILFSILKNKKIENSF